MQAQPSLNLTPTLVPKIGNGSNKVTPRRVLLIKPMTRHPASFVSRAESIMPPLGLLYIAARIHDRHEVKLIDRDIECQTESTLAKAIEGFEPEYVGVSAMSPQFPESVRIARLVRRVAPKAKTVVGGVHATAVGARIFSRFDCFDFVAQGEGEFSFSKLVDGVDPRIIMGLAFVGSDGQVINNGRDEIPDINVLQFPQRSLVKLSRYTDSVFYRRRSNGEHTTFLSSRGCQFKCTFCDFETRGGIRLRSAENIVAEMAHLASQGVTDFRMTDEFFVCNPPRTRKVCRSIIEQKLDIAWNCQTRADNLDRDTIRLMRAAGCYNMQVGVETGSPATMEKINKKLDLDKVKSTIKLIKSEGLSAYAFFMLGFPFESKEDMEQTIEFARSSELDLATFSIVTPYPGTPMWTEAGLDDLDLELLESLVFYSPIGKYFDPAFIGGMFKKAVSSFYMRPTAMWRLVREGLLKGSVNWKMDYFKFLALENPLMQKSDISMDSPAE